MRILVLLLAVGLPAPSLAAGMRCVDLETEAGRVASPPVRVGAEVRLRFRHSLWGSPVEEHFRIAGEGLELVRLRYGERRLVEFYGHEMARRAGNWWVVEGDRRRLRALILRASRESRMELSVGQKRIPLWKLAESGGPVRLAVAGCERRMPLAEGDRLAGRDR